MERTAWLREMQHKCEEQYDIVWAPLYGEEKAGIYTNLAHQQFIQELLNLLPRRGSILDAACGVGRYIPFFLEKGHSIVGIDQSQGMLTCARSKFPGVQFAKFRLQEIPYQDLFDGVICIDAMENVCPEEWPLVLKNFYEALKPKSLLYFTAETIENADEHEILQAFTEAQEAGLPVVFGECPNEDVYHYHPTNQQVKEWAQQAGFEILREGNGEIWYYHILAQKV